jgi:CCDC81-like prokaryotic HU domain 1
MVDLVTKYFITHNEVALPGVGMLKVSQADARYDAARQMLLPPRLQFQWNPQSSENQGIQSLAGFVSRHTQLTEEESFDAITGFCNNIKTALAEKGSFEWNGLGKLVRISDDTTGFVPDAALDEFLPQLSAPRAVHTGVSHQLLVGDKETNSADMQQLLLEEEVEEGRWWIAALVAGIAGLALIVARLGGWL